MYYKEWYTRFITLIYIIFVLHIYCEHIAFGWKKKTK